MTPRMPLSRRDMLRTASCGFGSLALAGLCGQARAISPLAVKPPNFTPKAKRVIFMCMHGAPSHVDTFDYKPELTKRDGQTFASGKQGEAKLRGKGNMLLMKSPFQWAQHGRSGQWISELFPHLAKHADDLCLINSLNHKATVHTPGQTIIHTGSAQFIRPSMGSWALYGLGAETQELPGFIVMNPTLLTNAGYQSAFLPQSYTGTRLSIGSRGEAIRNVSNPRLYGETQRGQLELIQAMNERHGRETGGADHVEAVIESFERGFRMQTGVPRALNLSDESAATLKLYGLDQAEPHPFARQCLLARRFAEQGVRFIEISSGSNVGPGGAWDHHRDIVSGLRTECASIDRPMAALLADLKHRGLLEETLVIWGGEFGRTPWAQGAQGPSVGRDHHAAGFTWWLAGGGVKGGLRYGATDEVGAYAVENKVGIHDIYATILHLLGLDHWNLTYKYGGRDYRLTDVEGQVIRGILA